MSAAITTAPAARRLGGTARKFVLVTHVVASGVWLGLDVAMAVLVGAAVATDDPQTRGAALQAVRLVTVWPMVTAGLVALLSGVLLGLGSRYGLVRYWWVLIKLVLTLVLCTLVVTALRGGVAEAAEAGRAITAGGGEPWTAGDLVFPPIVSTTALLVAYLLSFFKPWGRTRTGHRRLPARA